MAGAAVGVYKVPEPTPQGVAMRHYRIDSPQAVARIVAAAIVTDTRIDAREIALLDRLDAWDRIGLTRSEFMRVARDYCADLGQMAEQRGAVELLDRERLDALCGDLTDRRLQLLALRLIVAMVPADGDVHPSELALVRHLSARWKLPRAALAEAVDADVMALHGALA
jgi:hypothetical protein